MPINDHNLARQRGDGPLFNSPIDRHFDTKCHDQGDNHRKKTAHHQREQ